MNSPINSTTGSVSSTPTNYRRFYWPESKEEGSPKFCGIQERAEIFGWDDSPEPLKLEPKSTAVTAKKRIDPTVSPLSSHSRPKPKPPVKSTRPSAKLLKDLTAITELAELVTSRQNSLSKSELEPLLQDDLAETLIACTQQIESKSASVTSSTIPSVPQPDVRPLNSLNDPTVASTLVKLPSVAPAPAAFSASSSAACKLFQSSNCNKKSPIRYSTDVPTAFSPITNATLTKGLPGLPSTFGPQSFRVNRVRAQNSSSSSANSSPCSSPRVIELIDTSSSCSSRNSPFSACTSNSKGSSQSSSRSATGAPQQSGRKTNADNDFDELLKSFREEQDEWLSQVVIVGETKGTPGKAKGGFFKCRSDNNLGSSGVSSSFRRTASFHQTDSTGLQPLKKQKSFHIDQPVRTGLCSENEVEKKRKEALFRRKQREIEQKKLDAQKKRMEKEKMAVLMKKNANR